MGRPAGMSQSEVSRYERGLIPVDLERAVLLHSLVGLDLAVRSYPGGTPLRDRAHAALLARFRARLHPRLRWDTEVPLPNDRDQRSWDAVTWSPSPDRWAVPIEAESRPTDWQALERRLKLKMRDGHVDLVILLIADTRHGRAFVRALGAAITEAFPVPARDALQALGAGRRPSGSSLILL